MLATIPLSNVNIVGDVTKYTPGPNGPSRVRVTSVSVKLAALNLKDPFITTGSPGPKWACAFAIV
jgi:hypothetical protein